MTILFLVVFMVVALSPTNSMCPEESGYAEDVESHLVPITAGDGNFSSGICEEQTGGADAEYTITLLNTWPIPEGLSVRGLDYIPFWYDDHIVAYTDYVDDRLYFLDVDDGSSALPGGWDLYASNYYPFGVCHVPYAGDEQLHVNDILNDGMFSKHPGDPWVEYNSLTDAMGRGLDYHEDLDKIFDLYTISDPGDYRWFVAIFTPGQSTGSSYEIDCNLTADWYGTGVALFTKWNGDTAIAVTMYQSIWIRFFDYPDHPGEIYYGYGVIPYTMDNSFGLTYSDERGTFFHSYSIGSTYYISELEISEAALEADTWAGIKYSF